MALYQQPREQHLQKDTLAKDALQSTRQKPFLLCNRMMGNAEYGPERLKAIKEKETRQYEKETKDKTKKNRQNKTLINQEQRIKWP